MPDGPVVNTNLGPAPTAPTSIMPNGPVGMMNDLAEMRNRQNQAVLWQQQMAARHKLGEDLAVWASQGLTPEQQIDRASHQPYAPFVTPEIANFRTSNLAGVQVQETEQRINETKQKMFNAGLGPLAQALAATGGDPKKFPTAFKIATAGLSPDVAKSLEPSFKGMTDYITSDLPSDHAAADAAVKQKLQTLGATFGGLDLDKVYAMSGGVKPQVVEGVDAQGRPTKQVIAGGGSGALATTPIIAGPTTAQSAFMQRTGEQAAGLPPQYQLVKNAAGEEVPMVVSGGGVGTPPTGTPLVTTPAASPALAPPRPATPTEERAVAEAERTPVPPAVVGPSIAAKGFMEATGKLGGEILGEINSNAHTLPQMAKRVEMLSDAMEKFQSGGLANPRLAAATLVQGLKNMGLDISEDAVNKIGNGSVPEQQVFMSLISRAAVQSLKADAEGTGRVMRTEVDRYLDAIGANNDPTAIRKLLNNLRWNMAVGYDQSQKFVDFRNMVEDKDPKLGKYKQIADFPQWYNHNFDESKMEMPPGMSLGAIPAGTFKGEPKGLPDGAKVLKKNPSTGKWE